jgi:hypothetical protein
LRIDLQRCSWLLVSCVNASVKSIVHDPCALGPLDVVSSDSDTNGLTNNC